MTGGKPERGIRRTGSGWQVYVRVNGEFRSKHYPPETPITELRFWRESQKARHLLNLPDTEGQSFQRDADAYLALVTGMASYPDRAYRIRAWVDALGPRLDRKTLTATAIRRQLEHWRTKGLSAGSLNLRRTALLHLFTVLDGASAPNPVRDVPRYREAPAPLVLPTWKDAERAITAVGWPVNKDGKGRRDNLTRARLRVLLRTGWPASTLSRVKPEHIHWKRREVTVSARRKGKGIRARTLPLLPAAVTALKELDTLDGWGPFDTSSMHKALARACRKVGLPPFNPYALRHRFLTTLALTVKDDRVVAEMGLHSDTRQTRRYTEQSVSPRLSAGMGAMEQAIKRRR